MADLILPYPGGQISEPGAYRLTMERYHSADLCDGLVADLDCSLADMVIEVE